MSKRKEKLTVRGHNELHNYFKNAVKKSIQYCGWTGNSDRPITELMMGSITKNKALVCVMGRGKEGECSSGDSTKQVTPISFPLQEV